MTSIRQLSAVDELNAGDQVPLYVVSAGDARKFSLTTLVTFLTEYFEPAVVPTTVADLPSAATAGAGARAFVTDSSTATFNAVPSGGGANIVPVFSNGTNWRVG